MATKLEEMVKCNETLVKQNQSLQHDINEMSADQLEKSPELKAIQDKALAVQASSNSLMGACSEFMALSQSHHQHLSSTIHEEQEKRVRLQETVEVIAKQQHTLEEAVRRQSRSSSLKMQESKEMEGAEVGENEDEDDELVVSATLEEGSGSSQEDAGDSDDEFFDAEGDTNPIEQHRLSRVMSSGGEASNGESLTSLHRESLVPDSWPVLPPHDPTAVRVYRTSIPPKPSSRVSLWSVMKNCIGRELSKIPMPVNFNEPLSMLQRLCEGDMEYSDLLDRAAASNDSLEQLAMVAAYTVTSYSSTTHRTGKPFNPMLGETFEFDATADRGWRCLCEQVSHHPPSSAMHVESNEWLFWQDYTMASKFRGKYLQIIPQGVQHLVFRRSQNHYTWTKVVSSVHNIIVGKLWVDQAGELDIVNHKTGEYCRLKYAGYSYFSKEAPHKVTGIVYDTNKEPRFYVTGYWDKKMEFQKIIGGSESKGFETEPLQLAWCRLTPKPGSDLMYGYGDLACAMNEMVPGIAPTDSRFRPDQRLMEEGDYDKANAVKVKLEDAQRARRRQREARIAALEAAGKKDEVVNAQHQPRWFKAEKDPLSGLTVHVYKGGYWEEKKKGSWDSSDFLDLWSAGKD